MTERIRVVLVEDHTLVAQGLVAALAAEADIDVVGVACTVTDGLELVADLAPDVVLTDYRLPDGDGAALTGRVRAAHDATQVVFLTAADDPAVLAAAIEAGASGFVHKSAAIDDVVRAVRAAHAGEVSFRPEELAAVIGRTRRTPPGPGSDLTARELEVLHLLAEGRSTKEMVDRLVLSQHTVRNHVRNIMMKLDAHSKLEAVTIAARAGLVSLAPPDAGGRP